MNKNFGRFGVAIQTERGVAATAPSSTFYASADSDGLSADKQIQSLDLTKGNPTAVSSFVSQIEQKFAATTLSFPALTAFLLYAALGKIETEAADDGLFTHTITSGADKPNLTVFEQKGGSDVDIATLEDAIINTLTITAEGTTPLALALDIPGCRMAWKDGVNTWPGGDLDINDGYYDLSNAKVLFSLSDDTPVEVPLGIVLSKLEVVINNNVSAKREMGNASPKKQSDGTQLITVNVEGDTDSTDQYREALTGSKSGTLVSSQIVVGSMQVEFSHNLDPNQKLIIKLPAIPWKVDPMGVSTDGGDFSLKLSTDGALDLGNGAITCIVVNKTDSYTLSGAGATE